MLQWRNLHDWHALIRAIGLGGMVQNSRNTSSELVVVTRDTLMLDCRVRTVTFSQLNRGIAEKLQAEVSAYAGRIAGSLAEIGDIGETPVSDQADRAERHALLLPR